MLIMIYNITISDIYKICIFFFFKTEKDTIKTFKEKNQFVSFSQIQDCKGENDGGSDFSNEIAAMNVGK